MKKLYRVLFALSIQLLLSAPSFAWYDRHLERVEDASELFVENFNKKDSAALGEFYTRSGALKLPGTSAVAGRHNVVDAWQAGFDGGLDFLVLKAEGVRRTSRNTVLENGRYELTIQTPGGSIIQRGTFSECVI